MNGENPKQLALGLRALALFRNLLDDDVLKSLLLFLESVDGHERERVGSYCAFVARLYGCGGDFGAYLLEKVLESDNPVVKLRARDQREPPEMSACLKLELDRFTALAALSPAQVAGWAGNADELPAFASTPQDFYARYTKRLAHAATLGYGVFASFHMFTLGEDGGLLPVRNPDRQRLSDLTGYEREREQVVVNTKALLKGLAANNILLYGDAGTGKSSTVKALANEYSGEGLRLVELRKNQLYQIPALMDELAENPLKFVLFIDDLSFPSDDADFTALKAILEGNISARPQNIVVYATSNRRHLMRERFSDRMDLDVHGGDALEEQTSLAARFGLTITFLKPDRELYAGIVKALAAECGLKLPEKELLAKAEAHAIRYGGRSPRTARQFVELENARQALGGV